MNHWYAVYCRPRQDARAEAHLRNQGFQVYRPLARVPRRDGGRAAALVESLFPRYLFVYLDLAGDDWAPVRSTRGVSGLVRWGEYVPTVPAAVIAAIRARCDAETGIVDLQRTATFKRNELVRIAEGPFTGCNALFQRRSGDERVVVLLEIMHQAQRLSLDEGAISRLQ